MKNTCNRPNGETPGKIGTSTKHNTESNMGNSMKGVPSESLETGTSMRKPIGRSNVEKMNIPGVQDV